MFIDLGEFFARESTFDTGKGKVVEGMTTNMTNEQATSGMNNLSVRTARNGKGPIVIKNLYVTKPSLPYYQIQNVGGLGTKNIGSKTNEIEV